jgi:hypothetical protein
MAPGSVDVAAVLQDKRLLDHVQAFKAEPIGDIARVVRDAFDLAAIAARYDEFLQRWRAPLPMPTAPDDLARQLWLVSDWLLVLREDPRIPGSTCRRTGPPRRPSACFVAVTRPFGARRNASSTTFWTPSTPRRRRDVRTLTFRVGLLLAFTVQRMPCGAGGQEQGEVWSGIRYSSITHLPKLLCDAIRQGRADHTKELSLCDRPPRWHAREFRESVWPVEDVPFGDETMVLSAVN